MDYEDLKSCYSMPRTTSKGTFDMHNNMCNCRAMTWRQCWILVIVWEGLRCTMLQAKKQVPTVSSSVPYQGKIHIGGHVPILNMLHADRSLPISGLSYISNLLKAGANIDAQDHSGMTPLHLACRFGNISLVRTCLQISSDCTSNGHDDKS